ncbi:MAG: glycosyltransferase family 87 protein, partial [Pyrinomonadaceae bacterium]
TLVIVVSVFVASCELEHYKFPLLSRYMESGYRFEDVCLFIKRTLFTVVLVPAILIGHTRYTQLTASWRRMFLGFVSATALLSVSLIIRELYLNFLEPHSWDFLPRYIDGRVASLGLNFYHPESYEQALAASYIPFQPDESFLNDDVKTAFKYPPPTMLYFVPLGFFSFRTSHYMWTALNSVMILVNVMLVTKLFFAKEGWRGIATATSLLLLFPAARKIAYFEQTNFILLAWTLLLWRDRLLPRAGIWSAMAICTKPFMACVALYPLLRRKWGMITQLLVAGIVICALAVLAFGPSSFLSFFTERTLARIPNTVYLQWINQSLLSTVLRLTNYEFVHPEQFRHPFFLAGAAMITASTVWILHRSRSEQTEVMISLTLLLGLLLYPGNLNHYSLVCIIPILFLYRSGSSETLIQHWRKTLPWALCLLYVVFDVAAFYANLALWAVLITLCWVQLKREANGRQGAPIPG